MIARRFIIKGRVQGVGFRYFAVTAARSSGVVGWVRNLPDGSVEAIAEGPSSAIDDFRRHLQAGPSSGRVSSVAEGELPVSGSFTGFNVKF